MDTNIVSHALKAQPGVLRRLRNTAMSRICVSVITESELLFGLERGEARPKLRSAIEAFLRRVDVLDWNRSAAARYGVLRARLEAAGTPLAPLDMLIAAHALDIDAVLVTNDAAFRHVAGLTLEDWTRDGA